MSSIYRVTNYSYDFHNRKVKAYFTDYTRAIKFMQENRKRLGEGKLETVEMGNWGVMKTIVVKKYVKEIDTYLFYFYDSETLLDENEERYYKEKIEEVREENERLRIKEEEAKIKKDERQRSEGYRYSLRHTPLLGWCDYPEQFAMKCPRYHGSVSFKLITDPEYVLTKRKYVKHEKRRDFGKVLVTSKYIGQHDIREGERLRDHPEIKELWAFETNFYRGRFINHATKYMWKVNNGKLYDPATSDFVSDSSEYATSDFVDSEYFKSDNDSDN